MRSTAREPPMELERSLHAARERLRELLAGPETVRAKLSIGRLVADVKTDPAAYGVGAVAQMAESLGQDLSRLYRYASVAERWSDAEVRDALSDASPGEPALTWSHLVVLASIDDARDRARWMRRARTERLSVRELGARLARRKARDAGDARLERALRTAARFLAELQDDRLECLVRVRRRESLEQAIALHEKIQSLAMLRIEALRDACAEHDLAARGGRAQRDGGSVVAGPIRNVANGTRAVAYGAPVLARKAQ